MNGGELWIAILVLLTTIVLLISCNNGERKEDRSTQKRGATSQAQRRDDHPRETHELYAWPIEGGGRGLR